MIENIVQYTPSDYRHLLENNPALSRADYFPKESPWPEIAELRQAQLRLLEERRRTARAAFNLRREFEAEDEERKAALAGAIYEGKKPRNLPEVTPDDERTAKLRAAEEEAEAAWEAFARFMDEW